MSYHFSKISTESWDKTREKLTESLQKEGFGIVSEIDLQQKLQAKLGVQLSRYVILGACSPKHAYQAIQAESKIGTMLPCNVILRALEDGKIEVSAVDPVASMMAISNQDLGKVAQEVRSNIQRAIENF